MAIPPPLPPEALDALSAYLDDALAQPERAALEARLTTEPALAAALVELRAVKSALRTLPSLPAPRAFTLTPDQAARARRAERLLRFPASPAFSAFSAAAAVLLFVIGVGLINLGAPTAPAPGEAIALAATNAIGASRALDGAVQADAAEETIASPQEAAALGTADAEMEPFGGVTSDDAAQRLRPSDAPSMTRLPGAFISPAAPQADLGTLAEESEAPSAQLFAAQAPSPETTFMPALLPTMGLDAAGNVGDTIAPAMALESAPATETKAATRTPIAAGSLAASELQATNAPPMTPTAQTTSIAAASLILQATIAPPSTNAALREALVTPVPALAGDADNQIAPSPIDDTTASVSPTPLQVIAVVLMIAALSLVFVAIASALLAWVPRLFRDS